MAKPKSEISKILTGAEQVETMQALHQNAAAWLAGVCGRSLRDYAELKRDAAGKYNAQDVLRWAAARTPPVELSDGEIEKALTAADLLLWGLRECNAPAAVAVADYLADLQDRHGPGGLSAFTEELVRRVKVQVDLLRSLWPEPLPPDERRAEIERRVMAELDREEKADHEADLEIAVVCENCGRLRRGHTWIDATPPAGVRIERDQCPDSPECCMIPARKRCGR